MTKLSSKGTDTKHYDQVTQEQIEAGIVKSVLMDLQAGVGNSTQARTLESAETTKRHVIYNASACERSGAPLLSECLNPVHPSCACPPRGATPGISSGPQGGGLFEASCPGGTGWGK